jgi:hypothetical protein
VEKKMINPNYRITLKHLTGKQLRRKLVEIWLRNHTPGFFVTLSFNRRFFFERGFGIMDQFFKTVLQGAHGQRWQKRINRQQKFEVWGFCEHDESNVHFHLGVWGEADELKYLKYHGAFAWFKLQPQGDFLAQTINDIIEAALYSYKEVKSRDSQEGLYCFLFPDEQKVDQAKNKQKSNKERSRAQIWKNKTDKWLKLQGKVSPTKKNRGKMARYGGGEGQNENGLSTPPDAPAHQVTPGPKRPPAK